MQPDVIEIVPGLQMQIDSVSAALGHPEEQLTRSFCLQDITFETHD